MQGHEKYTYQCLVTTKWSHPTKQSTLLHDWILPFWKVSKFYSKEKDTVRWMHHTHTTSIAYIVDASMHQGSWKIQVTMKSIELVIPPNKVCKRMLIKENRRISFISTTNCSEPTIVFKSFLSTKSPWHKEA